MQTVLSVAPAPLPVAETPPPRPSAQTPAHPFAQMLRERRQPAAAESSPSPPALKDARDHGGARADGDLPTPEDVNENAPASVRRARSGAPRQTPVRADGPKSSADAAPSAEKDDGAGIRRDRDGDAASPTAGAAATAVGLVPTDAAVATTRGRAPAADASAGAADADADGTAPGLGTAAGAAKARSLGASRSGDEAARTGTDRAAGRDGGEGSGIDGIDGIDRLAGASSGLGVTSDAATSVASGREAGSQASPAARIEAAAVAGLVGNGGDPTPAGAASPPPAVTLPTPVLSPDFAPAFGVQVSVFAKEGLQRAELHLNPAEMGPVSVRISLDGMQARVDFGADIAATRQAIEAGLPDLAAALREAGFTLAGGGVSQHAQGGEREGTAKEAIAGRTDGRAGDVRANGEGTRVDAATTRRLGAAGRLDLYA